MSVAVAWTGPWHTPPLPQRFTNQRLTTCMEQVLVYAAGLASAPILYGGFRLVETASRAVDTAVGSVEETTDATTETATDE